MIDGYEKHTCTECETMFTSNEELQQHHAIDHGLIIENSIDWSDVQPEDKVEETDDGFTTDGKKITFSEEDKYIAESYLTETAKLQRVMVASEQRLKLARDEIKASEADTNAFYEQFLGESNGQDFSSGAGTVNPLDTPKFKYSKNNKLADTINTKGYNPNPNAGLYDNKEFKEGDSHLEDPLAKEDFEVSFYGGEAKANEDNLYMSPDGNWNESWQDEYWANRLITAMRDNNGYEQIMDDIMEEMEVDPNHADYFNKKLEYVRDAERVRPMHLFGIGEAKASERLARDGEQTYTGYFGNVPSDAVPQTGDCPNCGHDVGKHSGASTGDNLCYGGSDGILGEGPLGGCPCGRTFPYIKESKASEDWEEDLDGYKAIGKAYKEKQKMDKLDDGEAEASEFGDYEVKCDTCDGKGYELEWNGSEQEYFEDPCDACGGKGTNTWTSTVGKSDESLKADWDESGYEEKYSWLKDLGVDDAFKYANLTLYELPEAIWKVVNEDYVQGFKQMTGESYQPDQKDVVETSEEKIISRKLDNVPVGQIARELVLWDNMSEDEAEKMVSETEPSDDDMSAKSLFNKKYSELNENELAEMELYDV